MPPLSALSTALPVLLLPVRLETRFVDGTLGPELLVRIYPDQIAIDTFEPSLTQAEQHAGTTYWDALWRAGKGHIEQEKIAWRRLAGALGPQRAAWIALRLTPVNLNNRPAKPTPPQRTPNPPPVYPKVQMRASSWERSPLVIGMPDYVTIVTYQQGKETHRVNGKAIPTTLSIGLNPQSVRPQDPTALQVDKDTLWMVDFDTAVDIGMAVRIPLTIQETQQSFDRIIAFGVKTPARQQNGAAAFASLLDAHHYTDGLAFVPQGTPTNNTPDVSSAFSRQDPGYDTSFTVERQDPLASKEGDNRQVLAQALGIGYGYFDHVQYTGITEEPNAFHMARAFWPATLGYFLRQMLANVFSTDQISWMRAYFLSYVRPRGPLPAFRVGQTPYGVLPVTSLARWHQEGEALVQEAWISFLRKAAPIWLSSADATPRIGGTLDLDADLVHILGMEASSTAFRGRYAIGPYFVWNVMNWFGASNADMTQWFQNYTLQGRKLLDSLGLNTWDPAVIHLGFQKGGFPLSYPTVQDGLLSETELLKNDWSMGSGQTKDANYIHWLRRASIDDIRNENYPNPAARPNSLLYRVLRQSVLLQYSNLAMDALVSIGTLKSEDTKEVELVNVATVSKTVRPWDALNMPAQPYTRPNQTLGQYLEALSPTTPPPPPPPPTPQVPFGELLDVRASLDALATLPTAELDRLLTETLDTCSHRLDPWITSLATMLMMQQRHGSKSLGPGLYMGCFGWVENLSRSQELPLVARSMKWAIQALDRERQTRLQLKDAPRPVHEAALDNGGFIHAPSLPQATVAAILRNGYLTHRNSTDGQVLAIDLSSERVRTALWFLDGVRQGQPLGALLGYRFETAMNAKGLNGYIQPFRDAFPPFANKMPGLQEPGVPTEALAASNVVDGLALERAWAAKTVLPQGSDWGKIYPGLPGPGKDQDAVIALIRDLEDVVDALGDLSIAESVYQITQGNPVRAGGLLDAVSRGEIAPDPQVVATPRPGLDVHHRIMALFPGDVERVDTWQTQGHPRSCAEPRLDAWLTRLLPKPVEVKCRVNYTVPAGQGKVRHKTLLLTLADLQADPLDVLTMADAADVAQDSELEQRILYLAMGCAPANASNFQLIFEPDPHWGADDLTFPQLMVLARAVREMINGARPLQPQDLIEPDRQAGRFGGVVDISELRTRTDAALKALNDAIEGLQRAVKVLRRARAYNAKSATVALRDQLMKASWFGVQGSIPQSHHGADAGPHSKLAVQGDAVLQRLRTRYKDAASFNHQLRASNVSVSDLTTLMQKILDPSFVVLPRFTPPDGKNLENAFRESKKLLAGDKQALPRWLQQLTHVRPGVSRFDLAVTLARIFISSDSPALATQIPVFTLGQLPYQQHDRWLALPFIPGPTLPTSGRVALAAWMTRRCDAHQPFSGLLLDEWTERIQNPVTTSGLTFQYAGQPEHQKPYPVATTGLTFHYQEPVARAPQTLLLAYNPDTTSTTWSEDLLLAILNETLDLAKIRTVDLNTLQQMGQILPALYFPQNAKQDTIATDFITPKFTR